jgi:protocatechuate 3,4-dioxygenase beta subunit
MSMNLLAAASFVMAFLQTSQVSPPSTTQLVAGRIVEDGSRAPLSGARVMLINGTNGGPVSPIPRGPHEALTDQDGRYTFTGLDPGRYVVSAQKAGYATPVGAAMPRFDLAAGEQHVVADIALARGGVIAGRVIDPSGEPLADARVVALRPAPTRPNNAARVSALVPSGPSAQTNDLGEFRLFSLAPGTYYVQAAPQRSFGGSVESSAGTMLAATFYGDTDDPAGAQAVPVAAGQTFGEVVIRLLRVPAFTVSGVVIDESGQPVAGAEVQLRPDREGGRSVTVAIGPPNRTRSDVNGHFSVGSIASGVYTLLAAAPVITSSPADAVRVVPGAPTSGSTMTGAGGGFISTERINGVTTEFRADPAYGITVTVNDANAEGVQVTVPRSPRRPY